MNWTLHSSFPAAEMTSTYTNCHSGGGCLFRAWVVVALLKWPPCVHPCGSTFQYYNTAPVSSVQIGKNNIYAVKLCFVLRAAACVGRSLKSS